MSAALILRSLPTTTVAPLQSFLVSAVCADEGSTGSAMGHWWTLEHTSERSAVPLRADLLSVRNNVCKVPISDVRLFEFSTPRAEFTAKVLGPAIAIGRSSGWGYSATKVSIDIECRPVGRAFMNPEKCRCPSGSHGHRPGKCQALAVGEDHLCQRCHDKSASDVEKEAKASAERKRRA